MSKQTLNNVIAIREAKKQSPTAGDRHAAPATRDDKILGNTWKSPAPKQRTVIAMSEQRESRKRAKKQSPTLGDRHAATATRDDRLLREVWKNQALKQQAVIAVCEAKKKSTGLRGKDMLTPRPLPRLRGKDMLTPRPLPCLRGRDREGANGQVA